MKYVGVDVVLLEVYEWLMKPMNQPVSDYHDSCSVVMGKGKFTKEIEGFFEQRLLQTHPELVSDKELIRKCAVEYTKGFYE